MDHRRRRCPGGPREQHRRGLERLDVAIDGRRGSFLLMHSALSVRGEATASWTIVPDSGTGGLIGITGTADIQNTGAAVHGFSLGYTLPTIR